MRERQMTEGRVGETTRRGMAGRSSFFKVKRKTHGRDSTLKPSSFRKKGVRHREVGMFATSERDCVCHVCPVFRSGLVTCIPPFDGAAAPAFQSAATTAPKWIGPGAINCARCGESSASLFALF